MTAGHNVYTDWLLSLAPAEPPRSALQLHAAHRPCLLLEPASSHLLPVPVLRLQFLLLHLHLQPAPAAVG